MLRPETDSHYLFIYDCYLFMNAGNQESQKGQDFRKMYSSMITNAVDRLV